VTETAATCPEGVRDEAGEVMRCLRLSLCEPTFMKALALLVAGVGQREQCDIAERQFPDAEAK
jgi:hypothetical protein